MGLLLRLRLLFRSVGREALMLLYAFRHPATPNVIKIGTLFLLLYLISPFDLIPDFIMPLIGWADDVALLALGVPWLYKKLPQNVLDDVSGKVDRLLSRFGMNGAGTR
jgi:uncharacterized membrane protein YkvA (DUF1232 family)